jgi:hypothetical protein
MATSGAWIYCSCGHTVPEHGPDGKCRSASASGWPCDCQSLDVDDEETE